MFETQTAYNKHPKQSLDEGTIDSPARRSALSESATTRAIDDHSLIS